MPEVTTDAAVEQLGSGPVPAEVEETKQVEEQPKEEPKAAAEADEEPEAEEEPKPKRKGGWQRKIEKLETEVGYWREEALRNRTGSPNNPTTSGPVKPTAPKLSTFQGTVDEFEKAQEEYATKLEAYTNQLAQQQVAQQRIQQAQASFSTRLKELDDYEEVNETAQETIPAELVGPLGAECALLKNGTQVFRELIMDSDLRDELLELYDNRDISGMKAQIRALGIALRKTKAEAAPPKAAVTKAPKPPTPVTKPAPTDTGLRDDDSVEVWLQKRNAQLKARGE